MSSFIVVLDACVLVPASLRGTLVRAAHQGLYRVHWSEAILAEMHRSLQKDIGLTVAQADRQVAFLRDHYPEAQVTGYEPLIPALNNHPKDRHVLAAAIRAGAQVIVTFNGRDFPASSLDPYEIEAQHPDEFLTNLVDLDPGAMCEIVIAQAAALRNPPLTVDQLLWQLAKQVPGFADMIREVRAQAHADQAGAEDP